MDDELREWRADQRFAAAVVRIVDRWRGNGCRRPVMHVKQDLHDALHRENADAVLLDLGGEGG